MMTQIAVLAESPAAFNIFMSTVTAEDRDVFVHVASLHDIQGHLFSKVIRVGAYWRLVEHSHLYVETLRRVIINNNGLG